MHTGSNPPTTPYNVTKHLLHIILTLTLAIALTACSAQQSAQLQQFQQWWAERTERQALVALYEATDGPNWDDNTNWGSNSSICTWYGVTCTGGHVTRLSLGYNNLNGSIPPEIGQLSNLQNLYLGGNQLTSLPIEISQLSSLWDLFLGGNPLTTLPSEVCQLGTHIDSHDQLCP